MTSLNLIHSGAIPPTHIEIQRLCVEGLGADRGFVGSSDWIGSQEVAHVLSARYGCPSQILSFNSGKEVREAVTRLALHFETEGTPVMIGGGSGYALTLLGVEYDPHFSSNKAHKSSMWHSVFLTHITLDPMRLRQ